MSGEVFELECSPKMTFQDVKRKLVAQGRFPHAGGEGQFIDLILPPDQKLRPTDTVNSALRHAQCDSDILSLSAVVNPFVRRSFYVSYRNPWLSTLENTHVDLSEIDTTIQFDSLTSRYHGGWDNTCDVLSFAYNAAVLTKREGDLALLSAFRKFLMKSGFPPNIELVHESGNEVYSSSSDHTDAEMLNMMSRR
jgi:hypothetical protein